MIAALAIYVSLLADALIFATIAEVVAAGYEHGPYAVSAWAFCVVALAGWAVPRAMEGFDIGARKALVITGFSGLFLIYLLLRVTVQGDVAVWNFSWVGSFLEDAEGTAEAGGHSLVGGVLLIATWARTTLRSGDEIEMETMPRSLSLPFTIVTVFLVLGAITDRSGEVGRAAGAFYVCAILALVFSQLSLSGATYGDMRAGSTAGILLAGTAAAAVIGLLLVGLLATVLGATIGPAISQATAWTLTIILTPFAWVLEKFFQMLFGGSNPFPELTTSTIRTSKEAGNNDQVEQTQAAKAGLFVMRMFALLVFLSTVAILATIFVRLRHRRSRLLEDGRQASAVGDFREDLGSFFRGLLRRNPPRPAGYATTEATRLYLEVLNEAERAGHPREGGETAREFAPELQETFASPVTDDITRAFEAARYAGREPDARTVAELRARWDREARQARPT